MYFYSTHSPSAGVGIPDNLVDEVERIVGDRSGVGIDPYSDGTFYPQQAEKMLPELTDGLASRREELSKEIVSDGRPLRPWENDWLAKKVEKDPLCLLLRELLDLLEKGLEAGGQFGWGGD